MKPQKKLGKGFLIALPIIAIVVTVLGICIGSLYGDWKLGGYWGFITALAIMYIGHRIFNKQYQK